MTKLVLELISPEATAALARTLAEALLPGDVVFLEGDLGAGKTTMVRSMLGHLGWTGSVRSPSYALIHSYPTLQPVVHHLDLYRIGSAEEAMGLDLDHHLRDGEILLIEWADRLEGAVTPRFTVHLEITGSETRRARITASEMPILTQETFRKEQSPT